MKGAKRAPGGGRKRKPTAVKALAGNPGKRALNKAEPDFGRLADVDCPIWLEGEAAAMWKTVVPHLCAQGVLAPTDLHNVEAFCSAYGRWRQAEAEVKAVGLTVTSAMGSPMKNPAVTVINEALRQLAMFGALLGLDPSSRSRLMGGKKIGDANPFAALLAD